MNLHGLTVPCSIMPTNYSTRSPPFASIITGLIQFFRQMKCFRIITSFVAVTTKVMSRKSIQQCSDAGLFQRSHPSVICFYVTQRVGVICVFYSQMLMWRGVSVVLKPCLWAGPAVRLNQTVTVITATDGKSIQRRCKPLSLQTPSLLGNKILVIRIHA